MPAPATHNRQRLIQLIHIAKSQLQIDDATYRAILQRVGNQTSCADLPVPKLMQVLEEMKRGGFVVRSKARTARKGKASAVAKSALPSVSRALADDPQSKKIRALWLFLVDLGVVKNSSEAALAAYVKRLTKVDALQWVDGDQTLKVIESLKKWAMRFLPKQVEVMTERLVSKINAGELMIPESVCFDLRSAVNTAQCRQTFESMRAAWADLRAALGSQDAKEQK